LTFYIKITGTGVVRLVNLSMIIINTSAYLPPELTLVIHSLIFPHLLVSSYTE